MKKTGHYYIEATLLEGAGLSSYASDEKMCSDFVWATHIAAGGPAVRGEDMMP